jgi:hypothetical protein
MEQQQNKIWHTERFGMFTSSMIWKLLTDPRSKTATWSDTAMTYIMERCGEILTGEKIPEATSKSMEHGKFYEKDAFLTYKSTFGLKDDELEYFGAENPRFFQYSEFSGGSPDGLLQEDTVLEIKCPYNSGVHIEHMLLKSGSDLKEYSKEYYAQVQANMLFCNRSQADFISYDPRVINPDRRLHVVRVFKDELIHQKLTERIDAATQEMSSILKEVLGVVVASRDEMLQATIVQ